MAGRASGRGSENHTRPRIRHAGALSLTAVQDLERKLASKRTQASMMRPEFVPKIEVYSSSSAGDMVAGSGSKLWLSSGQNSPPHHHLAL